MFTLTLTHLNHVLIVASHKVAEGRQLVCHVQHVLSRGLTTPHSHRLRVPSNADDAQ